MLNQHLLHCPQINSKNIWIAYSGGIDSHVLLHLATQTFASLRAIHINDRLSPNSAQWQQHCEQICAQLNVPLECISVQIEPGASLENAARNARRAVWQQMLGPKDVLLLAHHADDQAETILYRLMRGTGPQGLVGMRSLTALGTAQIWRPLLNITKQEICDYAQQYNLKWIEDESNANQDFDRNYLRQSIIPLLQRRWPLLTKNINRAGVLTGQLLNAVEPAIRQKLAAIKIGKQLNLKLWHELPLMWRVETLRAWLLEHKINLSNQRLQTIMREVINARIDAQPLFKITGNITIRRSQQKLYILKTSTPITENFSVNWDVNTVLLLPNGHKLSVQELSPELRQKLLGLEIVVRMGVYGRKAKKIFQQFSIPPWERHNYPLVFAGGRLISVVGLWSSDRIH